MRREEIDGWFAQHAGAFGKSPFMDKLRELALLGLEAEARPEARQSVKEDDIVFAVPRRHP